MMLRILAAGIAASAPLLAVTAANAGEKEDAAIARLTAAYGGSKLVNLQSLRIEDESKTGFPGQGYAPGVVEFTPLRQDSQLDLSGERGSQENWSDNWNFSFLTRTVSAGEEIVTVNYATGTYQPAAQPDFFTAFGPVYRTSDTLLAYMLQKNKQTATWKGESPYLGRAHDVVAFEFPQSPPLTLYIDKETGFISKMTRETPAGALNYQFRDHRQSGGIGYASNFEFFVGPDVNVVTVSRKVTPNAVRASIFAIDRGVEKEPARLDTAEMTVDKIAEGVHLAGTGANYSLFVDAGDHVIGMGGTAGLKDRFDAYQKAAGRQKPLRYQIATHHHTDHLAGMADAFALGATFVAPKNAVGNLKTAVGPALGDDRIQTIDGSRTIGPVVAHDIVTNHAESNALVYVPSAKIAFETDHYGGLYADAPTPAGRSATHLKRAIEGLSLDVATLISEHNRKAVPWAEFAAAADAWRHDPCPGARPICR